MAVRTSRLKEDSFGLQGFQLKRLTRLATGDLFFDNVVLLSSFSGINGTNNFVDRSKYARTISITRDAPVFSSAQARYGATSLLLNGSSELSTSSTTGVGFGSGDYTIEFDLYYTGGNGYVCFGIFNGVYYGLTNGTKYQMIWNGSSVQLSGNTQLTNNVWQHHAVSMQAGVLRLFLNGALTATGSWSGSRGADFGAAIGATGGGSQYTTGYMANLRVTSGVGRYNAPFTPIAELFQGS
jgi:hypothetical protein